ncbi:MAG: type II toxin-antitoxin system VapC family toxin [Saprospiraceae bacterium]|jgi:PIN domain nuclease of toxin-antitoxin system|nr:type II toxin-antitoxin system VapC family toxin [Saprospiraceae bacterium]
MKRLLLDIHTLIWHLEASPLLSKKALNHIANLEINPLVSHVSLWEIAIKITVGKLSIPFAFHELAQKLENDGFEFLQIASSHIIKYTELPLHHRDPFDRLLIAQSIVENLPILGDDSAFDAYPVQRIW